MMVLVVGSIEVERAMHYPITQQFDTVPDASWKRRRRIPTYKSHAVF